MPASEAPTKATRQQKVTAFKRKLYFENLKARTEEMDALRKDLVDPASSVGRAPAAAAAAPGALA